MLEIYPTHILVSKDILKLHFSDIQEANIFYEILRKHAVYADQAKACNCCHSQGECYEISTKELKNHSLYRNNYLQHLEIINGRSQFEAETWNQASASFNSLIDSLPEQLLNTIAAIHGAERQQLLTSIAYNQQNAAFLNFLNKLNIDLIPILLRRIDSTGTSVLMQVITHQNQKNSLHCLSYLYHQPLQPELLNATLPNGEGLVELCAKKLSSNDFLTFLDHACPDISNKIRNQDYSFSEDLNVHPKTALLRLERFIMFQTREAILYQLAQVGLSAIQAVLFDKQNAKLFEKLIIKLNERDLIKLLSNLNNKVMNRYLSVEYGILHVIVKKLILMANDVNIKIFWDLLDAENKTHVSKMVSQYHRYQQTDHALNILQIIKHAPFVKIAENLAPKRILKQQHPDLVNQLLLTNKLAFKVCSVQSRWELTINQLFNYRYRPPLRQANKPTSGYKVTHLGNHSLQHQPYKRLAKSDRIYTATKKMSTTYLSNKLQTGIIELHGGQTPICLLFNRQYCVPKAFFNFHVSNITYNREWIAKNETDIEQYKNKIRPFHYDNEESFVDWVNSNDTGTINEALMCIKREAILGIIITDIKSETLATAWNRLQELEQLAGREMLCYLYQPSKTVFRLIDLHSFALRKLNERISNYLSSPNSQPKSFFASFLSAKNFFELSVLGKRYKVSKETLSTIQLIIENNNLVDKRALFNIIQRVCENESAKKNTNIKNNNFNLN